MYLLHQRIKSPLLSKNLLKTHHWSTLLLSATFPFTSHTGAYFDSVPQLKYILEHNMCINLWMQIAPNKCTIFSCLSNVFFLQWQLLWSYWAFIQKETIYFAAISKGWHLQQEKGWEPQTGKDKSGTEVLLVLVSVLPFPLHVKPFYGTI